MSLLKAEHYSIAGTRILQPESSHQSLNIHSAAKMTLVDEEFRSWSRSEAGLSLLEAEYLNPLQYPVQ